MPTSQPPVCPEEPNSTMIRDNYWRLITAGGYLLVLQQLILTKMQVMEERVNEQGINKIRALDKRVNEHVMKKLQALEEMNEQSSSRRTVGMATLGQSEVRTREANQSPVCPEEPNSTMIRQVHHSPPLLLLTVVVVVLQPRLASTESLLQSLTQEELVLSVIANQMAILRGMNESSSVCTSGVGDLQGLQQLMMTKMQLLEERINDQLMNMNEQVINKMQALEERVHEQMFNKMQALEETVNEHVMNKNEQVMNKMQTLEERVNDQVMSKTAALEEKMAVMVQEEVAENTVRQYYAHYVLHGGGRGTLYKRAGVSVQQCSWDVTLPEGTHPVFSWSAFRMSCGSCGCGSVTVWAEDGYV
ncbi:hypothetical protein GWK47_041293 [Chionoecetes opilio]|uniref:Uncharacterized protein n=1 Tax=Chionoecetes opilio TaxID=41210 RepID=A0A8J5CKR7_CHIOP|nr:hypothetical protein GWK47_041293 [Chionoecetes opilio]